MSTDFAVCANCSEPLGSCYWTIKATIVWARGKDITECAVVKSCADCMAVMQDATFKRKEEVARHKLNG